MKVELMSRMLLSINPEHVRNIVSGKKKFEFRKVRCRRDINSIVIYSTSPEMKVVAEAKVVRIIEDDIDRVWKLTASKSGISYAFFREYYSGRKTAVAYQLTDVEEFPEPKSLSDFGLSHAPQSFAYVA